MCVYVCVCVYLWLCVCVSVCVCVCACICGCVCACHSDKQLSVRQHHKQKSLNENAVQQLHFLNQSIWFCWHWKHFNQLGGHLTLDKHIDKSKKMSFGVHVSLRTFIYHNLPSVRGTRLWQVSTRSQTHSPRMLCYNGTGWCCKLRESWR